MTDTYTTITQDSWFSRIGQSLGGTLFGLLLFLIAFVILFINEGRAVNTHKMLQEGAGMVVAVDNARVDSANEGQLIHVSGRADTKDSLNDPVFKVGVTAIQLKRTVEMLQWQENKSSTTTKNLGGSTETETTYRYKKAWSERPIDSSQFHESGYQNPEAMAFESMTWQANTVTVGAFHLTHHQISRINKFEKFPLTDKNKLKKKIAGKSRIEDGQLYLGSKAHNEVGDLRVQMQVVYPTDVSIISAQAGNSFKPYQTKVGKNISMLSMGIKPATDMFASAEAANQTLTWMLRGVGLLVMFFGLKLMVKIFSVLADVVPLFGNIIGGGTSIIAFLVALVLSLITISVAWMFYRPLLSGGLLAVSLLVFWLIQSRAKKVPAVVDGVPAST
ncbi:MAG TPA: hypothetical protein ENJ84_10590 [Gammaproteobacteria bacterium]|nr:hypothetical protein [Gammaproteobacteria bacterium]